jgi:hypothetical protein
MTDDFIERLKVSSIVVTGRRRSGFIDAANAPERLNRILNGVE